MNRRSSLFTVIIVAISLSSGCSTNRVGLNYEGHPETKKLILSGIGEVVVFDNRGTDANWLGAVRGGYGNVLKTLNTELPVDEIVEIVYRQAFVEYGYLDEPDGHVRFIARVEKLDCSQLVNREAHVNITISLIDRNTDALLFSESYQTNLTESAGLNSGVFGNVETLRDLAEEALNENIDKSMTDLSFVAALANEGKPIESDSIEKLRRLKDIYDQGLINVEEYAAEKQKILDTM